MNALEINKIQNTEDTAKFVDNVYEKLRQKINDPYQINLLDEVHIHDDEEGRSRKRISENAHTRILRKILSFRDHEKKNYPLLESLLNFVAEKTGVNTSWRTLTGQIQNPQAESEYECKETSGRIDLLVKEQSKFAIIFENKINDAGDQEHQLARYIKQMVKEGFSEKQIFVLYLSSDGNEPTDQDWIDNDGTNYYENFLNRYFNLSYRDKILPWLEETEKDIPNDQIYLKSAFNQYIDYLKGKFTLREKERISLEEILKGTLNLRDDNDSLNFNISQIDDKITLITKYLGELKKCNDEDTHDEVRKLKNVLWTMKSDLLDGAVGDWPFEKYISKKVYDRDNYFGYMFKFNNHSYILFIGWNNRQFFCEVISYPQKGHPIDPVSDDIFKKFFDKGHRSPDWRASFYDKVDDKTPRDYQGAVDKMKEVLKIVKRQKFKTQS